MKRLIVLSGPIGVGKTSFAAALERFDVVRVSTRSYIQEQKKCENERRALQDAGDALDSETGGTWVADAIALAVEAAPPQATLLLDSARIVAQVEALKMRFPDQVFHVHLHARLDELERRYLGRTPNVKEFPSYGEAREHGTEAQVGSLAEIADVVLDTDHTNSDTLAVVAMALADTPIEPVTKLVDVIVGGQYGSEGKGNICARIAADYGALIRIGGPNAGHKVADPEYKYVQLPSGTGSNARATILIGAGSTLWLPQLLREIMDHGLSPDRLWIDPQAMVIDDSDRRAEAVGLTAIGTTGQGVGAATARKILNRGNPPLYGPAVALARDVVQLSAYVRDVRAELDHLYRIGTRTLLEGTQGTALSIHHGLYPHVTSRETSASGCLADAGISAARVSRVIMVVRTYPIRVGGPSGWMGREISFEEVSRRSGVPLDEVLETEKGSVSGRQRRIAEFDWAQLRRATEINGATEIALTFVDYLGVENREAKSFGDLNAAAQEFIRKVDRVAGVKVTLVSKAFARDAVLERGSWN